MAQVRFINGVSGDLNQSQYSNGLYTDIVSVGDNLGYQIQTYAGHDQIFLNAVTSAAARNTVFAGAGDDLVVGGLGIDLIHDGSGDDYVFLGQGSDTIYVGNGLDYYDGGDGSDTISLERLTRDSFGESEHDTQDYLRLDMALTGTQFVSPEFGVKTFVNFENVLGGAASEVIYGTSDANIIRGGDGMDQLFGREGNDSLFAGNGVDYLRGGLGADRLDFNHHSLPTTDNYRDVAVFEAVNESGLTASTRDTIFNFDTDGLGGLGRDDIISLTALDGNTAMAGDQAFLFRNTQTSFGTDARGEVRLQDMGTDVIVWIDTDADVAAEMSILVKNVDSLSIVDFWL